ncbi:MAG: adenylate/guanylate cyclase domain-containing protein [Elusimicrobia bacterium]|nr:adenylate/guanylate cyclase domain-containing protein [Candidatus Obscuribacterium magneticum]
MQTKNLAIMFTDIKGFTARTSSDSREGVARLLKEHDRLLVPVFRHFGGVIIKTIGDAFLVTFESPTDSVLCGLTIQEVLRQHNARVVEKDRIDVRVAINVGEVQLKEDDVLGEPVNLAARLEGITEAGEVYFTESVYLSMKRQEVPTAEIGERVFKGIPYPVRVYRVLLDPQSDQAKELTRQVELTEKGPVIHVRRSLDGDGYQRVIKLGVFVLLALFVAGAATWMWVRPFKIRREARLKAVEQIQTFIKGGVPEYDVWDTLRNILAENPADPEIPFQAGEILGKRFVPGAVFWLYEESIRRGGHTSDPRVFAAAARVFERTLPDEKEAQETHQAVKTYFPKKRQEWAGEALEGENAYALLNARAILQESNDPRLDDPARVKKLNVCLNKLLSEGDFTPEYKEKIRSYLQNPS